MKVLVISPLFPPQGSGAEISTMLECKELVENNVSLVVITNNSLSLKMDEGWTKKIKVYRVPMSFVSFIYPSIKPFGEFLYWLLQNQVWDIIKKIALRENVDVLHIEHAFVGFKPPLSNPIVLTIRDYWPICIHRTLWRGDKVCDTCSFKNLSICRFFNYKNCGLKGIPRGVYGTLFSPLTYNLARKMYRLFRRKLNSASKLITVSNFLKEKISENYPELREKMETIHTPLPNIPATKRLPSNANEIVYAYIGALSPNKGIVNLLQAFELAVKMRPNMRLIICGSGALQAYVKQFIMRKKLDPFVKYEGRVTYDQLRKIYEKTDVVVVPSLWPDPFPRTVIEAMLNGRPVLVNPVGGIKEQVVDRLNGFYANCYNVKELADKMLEISSLSRHELEEKGLKAREIILRKFDRKKRLKKLLNIYEKIL